MCLWEVWPLNFLNVFVRSVAVLLLFRDGARSCFCFYFILILTFDFCYFIFSFVAQLHWRQQSKRHWKRCVRFTSTLFLFRFTSDSASFTFDFVNCAVPFRDGSRDGSNKRGTGRDVFVLLCFCFVLLLLLLLLFLLISGTSPRLTVHWKTSFIHPDWMVTFFLSVLTFFHCSTTL